MCLSAQGGHPCMVIVMLMIAGISFCVFYVLSYIVLLIIHTHAGIWEKPHVETSLEAYRRSRSGDSSRSDR